MNEKLILWLKGVIIGDALGTPINGLSDGHIRASFKKLECYNDPEPALKNRMNKWRKPALYSSISQLAIVLAVMARLEMRGDRDFKRIFETYNNNDPNNMVFRHTDTAIDNFLVKKSIQDYNKIVPAVASTFFIPVITAGILFSDYDDRSGIKFYYELCKNFYVSPESTVSAMIYAKLVYSLAVEEVVSNNIWEAVIDAAEFVKNNMKEIYSDIFQNGQNPSYFELSVENFVNVFKLMDKNTSMDDDIRLIVSNFNSKSKNQISRPTIDNPLTVVPFVFSVIRRLYHDKNGIFYPIKSGGATQSISPMVVSVLLMLHDNEIINRNLIDDLVNKNKIIKLLDSIASTEVSEKNIHDFLNNERLITKKEYEEYISKNRHEKVSDRKVKKNRIDKNSDVLTKHVVESWTKIDKAKWKRERRNYEEYE